MRACREGCGGGARQHGRALLGKLAHARAGPRVFRGDRTPPLPRISETLASLRGGPGLRQGALRTPTTPHDPPSYAFTPVRTRPTRIRRRAGVNAPVAASARIPRAIPHPRPVGAHVRAARPAARPRNRASVPDGPAGARQRGRSLCNRHPACTILWHTTLSPSCGPPCGPIAGGRSPWTDRRRRRSPRGSPKARHS